MSYVITPIDVPSYRARDGRKKGRANLSTLRSCFSYEYEITAFTPFKGEGSSIAFYRTASITSLT